jgi:hypothetical protein
MLPVLRYSICAFRTERFPLVRVDPLDDAIRDERPGMFTAEAVPLHSKSERYVPRKKYLVMTKKPLTKSEREALQAKLQTGYRASIRETMNEIERDELLASLEEIRIQLDNLQVELQGPRDPTWKIALRIIGIGAVWLAFGAVGFKFGGVWGAIGALVAPFVLLLGGVVVFYYADKLIRGKGRPIGDLSVECSGEQRRVKLGWTGEKSALPLGLLAQFDRKVWEWGVRPKTKKPGLLLSRVAREAAEARLRGEPAQASNWTVELGTGRDASVLLERDRVGIEYSTSHFATGGPRLNFPEERAATLALIDHGLSLPNGEQFARAVIDIAKRYEKGHENGRKIIRKLGSTYGIR